MTEDKNAQSPIGWDRKIPPDDIRRDRGKLLPPIPQSEDKNAQSPAGLNTAKPWLAGSLPPIPKTVDGITITTRGPLTEAMKNDAGKGGFEFLPMDALQSINEVLRFGAQKYAPHNWEKGFSWVRLGNAILRHTFAWMSGEMTDAETGLPHLAHAGCMVLFALSHQLRGIGHNDIAVSQTARKD